MIKKKYVVQLKNKKKIKVILEISKPFDTPCFFFTSIIWKLLRCASYIRDSCININSNRIRLKKRKESDLINLSIVPDRVAYDEKSRPDRCFKLIEFQTRYEPELLFDLSFR